MTFLTVDPESRETLVIPVADHLRKIDRAVTLTESIMGTLCSFREMYIAEGRVASRWRNAFFMLLAVVAVSLLALWGAR